jgi:hypothetical protein
VEQHRALDATEIRRILIEHCSAQQATLRLNSR